MTHIIIIQIIVPILCYFIGVFIGRLTANADGTEADRKKVGKRLEK